MTTRRWRLLGGGLAMGFVVALLGSAGHSEPFKGPAYLLIEGGGLQSPVVVHHGARDRDPGESDLLRLMRNPGELVSEPQSSRYYEVYEFWWSPTTPVPAADGTPNEPLDPNQADAVFRIYPDEPEGPAWNPYLQPFFAIQRMSPKDTALERPVPSPEGYRRISETGRELLESYGLTFGF